MFESIIKPVVSILFILFILYSMYVAKYRGAPKPISTRRTDAAFPLWEAALTPYGWSGEVEHVVEPVADAEGVPVIDARNYDIIKLAAPGDHQHRQWMSLHGENGAGTFQLYGETGVVATLDLAHARLVGARAALRASVNASHLAALLDADAERALGELPGAIVPGRVASLVVGYGLSVEWGLPVDEWKTNDALGVMTPAVLVEHAMALKRAIIEGHARAAGRDAPDAEELLELTRTRGPIASMLAARALLALHPGTSAAREWTLEHSRKSAEDRATLMGWSIDAVDGVAQGTPEWCAARALAIIQGDAQTGAALTRHALDVVDTRSLLEAADRVVDAEIEGEPAHARKTRASRDRHLFACFVIASFQGENDVEAFAQVYGRLVGQVKRDYEVEVDFTDLMGDLDGWHPALVASALSHDAHDDVQGFWSSSLDEEDLGEPLVDVVPGDAW